MPAGYSQSRKPEEIFIEYRWKKKIWNSIQIYSSPELKSIEKNSQENFFTAQHWGYTKIKEGRTKEYSVEHPKWQMYETKAYEIKVDFAKVFGSRFGFLSDQQPELVFLAEGSEIVLKQETTIQQI